MGWRARARRSVFFEAGEGGVDGADGDVVAGAAFDFVADGDAVGVGSQVEEGEHDEELELAESGFWHRLRDGPRNGEPGIGAYQIFEKGEEIDTFRFRKVSRL